MGLWSLCDHFWSRCEETNLFIKSRIPAGIVGWDCFPSGMGPILMVCTCLYSSPHGWTWHLFFYELACFSLCLTTMWFSWEEQDNRWAKLLCTESLWFVYNCLHTCEGNTIKAKIGKDNLSCDRDNNWPCTCFKACWQLSWARSLLLSQPRFEIGAMV